MPSVLTIAGSDSGGGAGVQADLKTFAAFGVYGTSAITAITAQNTMGVCDVMPLAADLVTAQIEAVAGDIDIHAVKIGVLATAAIAEAVAAAIEELQLPMVVLDPVMASSAGVRLLDDDGMQMLRTELLPRAFVVTPNLPEAEALSGFRIESVEDRRRAAARIHKMGASAVIITGGHASDREVVDVLFDGKTFREFRRNRIETRATHGTGCTFAAAVAASLALGRPLTDAAERAQAFVAGALAHAVQVGHGAQVLDHFWQNRSV